MSAKHSEAMSFFATKEMKKWLANHGKRQERTVSQVIRIAITQYIARFKA